MTFSGQQSKQLCMRLLDARPDPANHCLTKSGADFPQPGIMTFPISPIRQILSRFSGYGSLFLFQSSAERRMAWLYHCPTNQATPAARRPADCSFT